MASDVKRQVRFNDRHSNYNSGGVNSENVTTHSESKTGCDEFDDITSLLISSSPAVILENTSNDNMMKNRDDETCLTKNPYNRHTVQTIGAIERTMLARLKKSSVMFTFMLLAYCVLLTIEICLYVSSTTNSYCDEGLNRLNKFTLVILSAITITYLIYSSISWCSLRVCLKTISHESSSKHGKKHKRGAAKSFYKSLLNSLRRTVNRNTDDISTAHRDDCKTKCKKIIDNAALYRPLRDTLSVGGLIERDNHIRNCVNKSIIHPVRSSSPPLSYDGDRVKRIRLHSDNVARKLHNAIQHVHTNITKRTPLLPSDPKLLYKHPGDKQHGSVKYQMATAAVHATPIITVLFWITIFTDVNMTNQFENNTDHTACLVSYVYNCMLIIIVFVQNLIVVFPILFAMCAST
uniref:ORF22 n=1 Tax=Malaco herpesvirus 4 TaxID=3031800 RepID=A0AA48P8Y2_9VIRU|nr:TPA_asm: ORF22 [Malaco herpesvirus 4]